MRGLDGILKLTENELESISSSGKFRSKDDVELTYKLIDIAKDIYCIWGYEDEGYSNTGMSYRSGRSMRDEPMSYERRRMPGNSYRRGYSRTSRDEYLDELRDLMESAPDEQTRQSIHKMIQQMENQM